MVGALPNWGARCSITCSGVLDICPPPNIQLLPLCLYGRLFVVPAGPRRAFLLDGEGFETSSGAEAHVLGEWVSGWKVEAGLGDTIGVQKGGTCSVGSRPISGALGVSFQVAPLSQPSFIGAGAGADAVGPLTNAVGPRSAFAHHTFILSTDCRD